MTRHHPAGTHPDPQIAKLPKWAQQHVSKLERRIEELQAQLDSFAGQVTADTMAWQGSDSVHKVPLIHPQAAFRVGPSVFDVALTDELDGLYVRSERGGLEFEPVVSNAVILRIRRGYKS